MDDTFPLNFIVANDGAVTHKYNFTYEYTYTELKIS